MDDPLNSITICYGLPIGALVFTVVGILLIERARLKREAVKKAEADAEADVLLKDCLAISSKLTEIYQVAADKTLAAKDDINQG